jgi:hypothetical protein
LLPLARGVQPVSTGSIRARKRRARANSAAGLGQPVSERKSRFANNGAHTPDALGRLIGQEAQAGNLHRRNQPLGLKDVAHVL